MIVYCPFSFKAFWVLVLISILSILPNYAQNKEFKVFKDKDGNKISEGYLEDGKPNDYWITYYSNGNKKSEGNRKNFLLDSTWTFYHLNGTLKRKINYSKGNKHGWDWV